MNKLGFRYELYGSEFTVNNNPFKGTIKKVKIENKIYNVKKCISIDYRQIRGSLYKFNHIDYILPFEPMNKLYKVKTLSEIIRDGINVYIIESLPDGVRYNNVHVSRTTQPVDSNNEKIVKYVDNLFETAGV